MNRQNLEKAAVAFLLMLFIFVLGNMIFNLENLDLGGEEVPAFVPQTGESQPIATSQTVTRALLWVYYGILAFCILMVIIGAGMFAASKDRKKWKKLFVQMLGVLLAIVIILAFAYFYEDIESSVTGVGSTNLPGGGNASVGGGNATAPTEAPDTVKVLMTFGLFAIVFLFCLALFIGIHSMLKLRSAKLDYSDIEREKKEITQAIQRTIDALAGGSDTRATVIRCYTDMCKAMAKQGIKDEEHLTPREFQRMALERLPVPEEQMAALVGIFEEARYSQHALGSDAGQRALEALEGVRGKLTSAEPEKREVAA